MTARVAGTRKAHDSLQLSNTHLHVLDRGWMRWYTHVGAVRYADD